MARKKAPAPSGQIRRTVTIPIELDRIAHDLVGEREFSALVVRSLEREVQGRRIDTFVAAYEARHGAIGDVEMKRAGRSVRKR